MIDYNLGLNIVLKLLTWIGGLPRPVTIYEMSEVTGFTPNFLRDEFVKPGLKIGSIKESGRLKCAIRGTRCKGYQAGSLLELPARWYWVKSADDELLALSYLFGDVERIVVRMSGEIGSVTTFGDASRAEWLAGVQGVNVEIARGPFDWHMEWEARCTFTGDPVGVATVASKLSLDTGKRKRRVNRVG